MSEANLKAKYTSKTLIKSGHETAHELYNIIMTCFYRLQLQCSLLCILSGCKLRSAQSFNVHVSNQSSYSEERSNSECVYNGHEKK